MNNTLMARPNQPRRVPGKTEEKPPTWKINMLDGGSLLLCFMAEHVTQRRDTQQAGGRPLTTSGKCEATVTAETRRVSLWDDLNEEGRRCGGGGRKEVRGAGKTWLGSAPAQTLPPMMWNGKAGFYFRHKEIIPPSNCLLCEESRPNRSQLLQLERVIYAICYIWVHLV